MAGRKRTSVLPLFEEVHVPELKCGFKMKCTFCEKTVAKNGTRMEEHVKKCKKMTDNVKESFLPMPVLQSMKAVTPICQLLSVETPQCQASKVGSTSPDESLNFNEASEIRNLEDCSSEFKISDMASGDHHGGAMETTPGGSSVTPCKNENYLTCSPLIIPGFHQPNPDDPHGGDSNPGPSSEFDDDDGIADDYIDNDDVIVKKESFEACASYLDEICDDENSENMTQSSCDRPPSQSSPAPVLTGPYLLKKETHCTTILDQLLQDETFADVTLTAEGQSLKAHKIVLCLASGYFKQVLSKESSVQNVIFFRDVKFAELKNIVNFIYTGEATVDAAELESFMKTAELLEVTSLVDGHRNLPRSFWSPKAKNNQNQPDIPEKPESAEKTTPTPERAEKNRSMNNNSKRSHNQVTSNQYSTPPAKSRRVSSADNTSKTASTPLPQSTSASATSTSLSTVIKSEPIDEMEATEEGTEPGTSVSTASTHSASVTLSTLVSSVLTPEQGTGLYNQETPAPSLPESEDSLSLPLPGVCPFCPDTQLPLFGSSLSNHFQVVHSTINLDGVVCCEACSRVFCSRTLFEAHRPACAGL